jgi:hypothetical protein
VRDARRGLADRRAGGNVAADRFESQRGANVPRVSAQAGNRGLGNDRLDAVGVERLDDEQLLRHRAHRRAVLRMSWRAVS